MISARICEPISPELRRRQQRRCLESPRAAGELLFGIAWLVYLGLQLSAASFRGARVDGLGLRCWRQRRWLESPDVHGKPVLRNVRRSYLSLLQENQGGWDVLSVVVVFSEAERRDHRPCELRLNLEAAVPRTVRVDQMVRLG